MTPAVAHRQNIERNIVTLIVENALDKGYSITIFDGEEDAVRQSKDAVEILEEAMNVEEEKMIFYRPDGEYAGFVFLVYGNDGWDAINDHSDTDEIRAILSLAQQYADTAEADAMLEDFNYVGSKHHY